MSLLIREYSINKKTCSIVLLKIPDIIYCYHQLRIKRGARDLSQLLAYCLKNHILEAELLEGVKSSLLRAIQLRLEIENHVEAAG